MTIKSGTFRERGGWWVVAQFALFGLILLAMTRNHAPGVGWQMAGWALVVAGALAAGGGLWAIRETLTALPAPIEHAVLRQRGPYAIVRHPIYGGLILGFAGLSIQGGNVPAFALSLGLIPFFYAKTSVEERMLISRFPEYAEYQERVRFRVLPWVI
jgi:protein-S-isoprenylcysteine O-methyltransferase Ste14